MKKALLILLIGFAHLGAQAGGIGPIWGYMKTDDLDSASGPGAKLKLDLTHRVGLEIESAVSDRFRIGFFG